MSNMLLSYHHQLPAANLKCTITDRLQQLIRWSISQSDETTKLSLKIVPSTPTATFSINSQQDVTFLQVSCFFSETGPNRDFSISLNNKKHITYHYCELWPMTPITESDLDRVKVNKHDKLLECQRSYLQKLLSKHKQRLTTRRIYLSCNKTIATLTGCQGRFKLINAGHLWQMIDNI